VSVRICVALSWQNRIGFIHCRSASGLKDILLVGLLLIASIMYATNYGFSFRSTNAVVFLGGITLGRGARVILEKRKSGIRNYLIGLVVLLAFSSWWHLDMTDNSYHGPRWMGLWNNPNIYGVLMGAGVILATGLLLADGRWKSEDREGNIKWKPELILKWVIKNWESAMLVIALVMMEVGLLFSYSRGAWLGTSIGLLYLAKAYGKFKLRYVLTGIFITATVVWLFWNATPDNAPWYVKRMDFGRPSAQHRVAAWSGAFQIMRDYPLGVGWNRAVQTYDKNYSPPEGGASAITTNDYVMFGTQLGLPALLCFIAYIYLKFKPKVTDSLHFACRAGALVLLVAFWFDGGLFHLPTAAVFWILLELGTSDLVADKN